MAELIPIQYKNFSYPAGIIPHIQEIAGHFKIQKISPEIKFSLHTEYSYYGRELDERFQRKYPAIHKANKNGIPMLWFSKEWAAEFSCFVQALCSDCAPLIIEIHPPFSDYSSMESFLDIYHIFESSVSNRYPHTRFLLENRCGTVYKNGKFIFSELCSFFMLSDMLDKLDLKLKITFDIPQLFSAHKLFQGQLISDKDLQIMSECFFSLKAIRHNICGIHLWGKKRNSDGKINSHVGDLNTYFHGNLEAKNLFLACLFDFLDGDFSRVFVPEVNSSQTDLNSIVNDMLLSGIRFV